jgi:two-component system, sensor histidine kinase
MSPEMSHDEQRVLLLTPTGRDAALISRLLKRAGCNVHSCSSPQELCQEILSGAASVVLAEEGLPDDSLGVLTECLNDQPAWSDLPVIVLTMAGKTTRHSAKLANALKGKVNLAFLERPLRMLTLVSAVQSACRARARQYEIRALLAKATAEVETRDRFIAMLGHELRNPLAAIRTSVEILSQFGSSNSSLLPTQAEIISRQSNHMARLVDDLLDVARLTSGRVTLSKATVDVREIIQRSIQGIRLAIGEETRRISTSLPSSEVIVEGDAVRLEQVVGNLLSNAIRYSPKSARIDVMIEVQENEALIHIRDEGEGIDPELLPRIFEPFVQSTQALARARGGLGLGLAIVKNLVLQHGGTVTATSAGKGAGSEFIVRLPLAKRKPDTANLAVGPEKMQSDPKRVLIIEDNADARQSLAQYLRLLDHEVFEAEDGISGLEKLLSIRPDVALIDVGLPHLSGYELVSRAKQTLDSATLMVAVTGYGQSEDQQRAMTAGFDKHLVKPLDLKTVIEMLSN